MAVLDATNRTRIGNHAMRVMAITGLLKSELRAAIDATDQWIDDNGGAFNTALPLPARTTLTASQKTELFCYVALRRAGLLKAQED